MEDQEGNNFLLTCNNFCEVMEQSIILQYTQRAIGRGNTHVETKSEQNLHFDLYIFDIVQMYL